ncbi:MULTISPECIES: hypothetical protein [Bradyrhizobium]|uniref:Uncharacterized protein n=1 Tax=Bradyrhizobium nanningense TaxID=1325118 RepID=A0A4V1L161_9BRAD|nr:MULTISPECIES: hypothetical protein [Bradyrhizobium]RXH23343.1 hypothetical protein XH99_32060 [Bradyrhizobium nanningense]RXH27556.1 hypothetical protein XH84_29575 [Bradyrhizobium nanningense]TQF28810.1 hypothetical protein UNPA324_03445 [Bradyrhizobium sp. UNPA324]
MKAHGATSSAAGLVVGTIFDGKIFGGKIFGGKNFETTANTMTISRHGSHRKLLAEIAVIGLAHRGHVMQAER